MNQQDIIDKIQKLLSLANSPNENEAAQAAAKAQQLLMQHNLSLEDIKAKSTFSNSIEREELEAHKRKIHWKGKLAHAIADANFCKIWWHNGRLELAGKSHNRAIVKSLYEYLSTAIERLANLGVKAEKLNYKNYLEQIAGMGIVPMPEPNWRTWKSSFITGCSSRLCDRIKEQTDRMKTEGIPETNVTGLICRQAYDREREAITIYLQSLGISLRRCRANSKANFSRDGYSAGQRAADSISLNRQVNASSGARLLK